MNWGLWLIIFVDKVLKKQCLDNTLRSGEIYYHDYVEEYNNSAYETNQIKCFQFIDKRASRK